MDKWLWQARFFKTRSLAARQVSAGHVRVNATKITKASTQISPGDVLTFPQGNTIRVVKIDALAKRRGPAPEAQTLYIDMTPEAAPQSPRVGPRPTKKDRRDLDAFRED
ncbi:RNA-binding S4 domain-containing protein [Jannaschia sp. CCS1]|uniref:RNA-binding S4 domain-containing protein n=1 Tax=Jannaschia sp. (strain CCS1) TaxID=290400 RepID=UPI000053C989|nr:RNA-binding S4 domain-containing protein [Jannaschia sp. CCS1]ABD56227.1 heat shock protein Hsp15 [Jannaschia sp. CCS1]